MATLHEARHLLLGTRAAVKRMLPGLPGGEVSLARFRKEAVAALRVRHPNVVRVYDYGVDASGVPYLAMELLDGTPLSATLATVGAFGVRQAADLFLPLLAGVSAVHAAGVVHRDLKPHNIFLRRRPGAEPDPVVIDLGIAKILDSGEGDDRPALTLTSTGAPVGTAAYMAPEQILGDKSIDPAADQYALGVTLYECLTGRAPFTGDSVYELMHAALNAPLCPPGALRPGIPPEVDAVVLRAMAREPEDRFPSVAAMGEALLPFASEAAVLAWRADALPGRRDTTTTGSVAPVWMSSREGTSPLAETMAQAETMAPWGPTNATSRPARKGRFVTAAALVAGALAVAGAVAVNSSPAGGDRSRAAAVALSPSLSPLPSPSIPAADAVPAIVAASSVSPGAPPSASDAPVALATAPRPVPRPAPRATRPASAASIAAASVTPVASSTVSCDPPYFFDARGNRVFKPDCL
jgi:serine/threonine-protein kinase